MSYTANINIKNLSHDVLDKAKRIRTEIDKLENDLAALLSEGEAPAAKKSGKPVGRRGRPAKAASVKTAKSAAKPRAKKQKRKLSPEARARIVAAVKARWARQKGKKA